jgi:hypothetical protein
MSISSVNGNCPVRGAGDEKFFPVRMEMEEKVPPKEVWG